MRTIEVHVLAGVEDVEAGDPEQHRQPHHQRHFQPDHSTDRDPSRQRRQHNQPDQRRAYDLLIKSGRDCSKCDDAGHGQAGGHEVVDAHHVLAQAEIDLRGWASIGAGRSRIVIETRIVGHSLLLQLRPTGRW